MELGWRKSSFSADTGACVEIAEVDGIVLLREGDDPDVIIRVTRRRLRALLDGVRAGEFDDFT